MSKTRGILTLATCIALLTACGSEYQPYTSAPEPPNPPLEALLVRAGPNSTGTGTVAGSGIDCAIAGATQANTCTASLSRGKVVTLTAGPSGGSTFLAWGDACAASGSSPTCTVTLSEALAVSASFAAPPPPPPPPSSYLVTVVAGSSSTGTGTITGNGISCAVSAASQSGDCSEQLVQGSQLALTVAATGGSTFAGWGGACSQAGTSATCTISVRQAATVSASFTAPPPPNLAGFWSGTDAGGNIHYHITLAQSGATLSLASCVVGDCRLTALSSTGSGWLGASYADIAALTGTVSTTSVTFTMNLGDRTVKFEGALTSPTTMVGQLSGPTMPLQSLTLGKQ